MEKYELQKLRDLPVEGVAERLGLQVVRHKCLCPFHDDRHPSLSFSVSRNSFRCFVCGASGGTIDLVMRLLRKTFTEACRWLADEHNIIVDERKPCVKAEQQKPFDASRYERFFLRPWLSPEARRFLYEERRIDARVVRWCRLTSWTDRQGTCWLQIPYYDREGKLIGIQNRNINVGKQVDKLSFSVDKLSFSVDELSFSVDKLTSRQVNKLNEESSNSSTRQLVNSSTKSVDKLSFSVDKLTSRQVDKLNEESSNSSTRQLVNSSTKSVNSSTPPPPRFRFPYGSRCSIYNLPVLKMLRPQEPLYITEGCSDCWAMLSAGHKAIAIPSATLLKPKDVEQLSSLIAQLSTPLHMFPDRDEPGERLFLQLQQVFPGIEHHQLPPGCKDFGEWWSLVSRQVFRGR